MPLFTRLLLTGMYKNKDINPQARVGGDGRRQGKKIIFLTKNFEIQIFIAIFAFSMKNAFK